MYIVCIVAWHEGMFDGGFCVCLHCVVCLCATGKDWEKDFFFFWKETRFRTWISKWHVFIFLGFLVSEVLVDLNKSNSWSRLHPRFFLLFLSFYSVLTKTWFMKASEKQNHQIRLYDKNGNGRCLTRVWGTLREYEGSIRGYKSEWGTKWRFS